MDFPEKPSTQHTDDLNEVGIRKSTKHLRIEVLITAFIKRCCAYVSAIRVRYIFRLFVLANDRGGD